MESIDHSPAVDSSTDTIRNNMLRFKAVLSRVKLDSIPTLASHIRQNGHISIPRANLGTMPVRSGFECAMVGDPLFGSYHVGLRLRFEDGMQWLLKAPRNGHGDCFNDLAARSLVPEALTMCMLKRETTIPIPTAYGFDASIDNVIGCPFILMEFLTGERLYTKWFDRSMSRTKLQQFRARALQTIASAMVQLKQYEFDQGGALLFKDTGDIAVVQGAKVYDGSAALEKFERACCDGTAIQDEDPFCEKGPFTDPENALCFMSSHRKSYQSDTIHDQGVRRSLCVFTEWSCSHMDTSERKFVLGHPNFNWQNLLVQPDGTLSGIIDWDRVAAIPHSVGCLRYPMFLTRDWELHYENPANLGDRSDDDDPENTPEELEAYRASYAQYVETALTNLTGDASASGEHAKTTRLSLLTTTMEAADSNPTWLLNYMYKIWNELEAIVEDVPDVDISEADSASSDEVFDSSLQDKETEPSETENDTQSEIIDNTAALEQCIANSPGSAQVPSLEQDEMSNEEPSTYSGSEDHPKHDVLIERQNQHFADPAVYVSGMQRLKRIATRWGHNISRAARKAKKADALQMQSPTSPDRGERQSGYHNGRLIGEDQDHRHHTTSRYRIEKEQRLSVGEWVKGTDGNGARETHEFTADILLPQSKIQWLRSIAKSCYGVFMKSKTKSTVDVAHLHPRKSASTTGKRSQPVVIQQKFGDDFDYPSTLVSRNEPCPCGSRRKFKTCCGEDDGELRTSQGNLEHGLFHAESVKDDSTQKFTEISSIGIKECLDQHMVLKDRENEPTTASSKDRPAVGEEAFLDSLEDNESDGEPDFSQIEDEGGFTICEICVALGNDTLDEERFDRLKKGFHLLIDRCLGNI